MSRAISPREVPGLPEGATGWRRSTRRAGGMYHAHDPLGRSICGTLQLDRHKSEEPRSLGDFQYWGACPRCHRKAEESQP